MPLPEAPVPDPLPAAPLERVEDSRQPSTALIGLDDTGREFAYLYADARGIRRVYRMLFTYPVWTLWRDPPALFHRFTGTFSDDGHSIRGRWDRSSDGRHWERDVAVRFRRR